MEQSLGVIEAFGFVTAMEAADAAVKAANVQVGEWLSIGGGKVNIIIRGDVAAVKTAVEAGVAAASNVGRIEGTTIIARPSEKLGPVFPIAAK